MSKEPPPMTDSKMEPAITDRQARLLEAYGPLEMARIIEAMADELKWIVVFAEVRAKDSKRTMAEVGRGAMNTIATRGRESMVKVQSLADAMFKETDNG